MTNDASTDTPTLEVAVTNTAEHHDALTAFFEDYGAHAFYLDGDTLRAYLKPEQWSEEKETALRRWLDTHAPDATLSHTRIAPRNWNAEWEASITPQHIGPFFVRPSWAEEEPPPEAQEIIIDPKMSFGTGYHPSTRLVLELLPELPCNNARVLDAGTGTGILAIAACLQGARHVDAFDIDTWAAENATENIAINNVADRVRVIHGSIADTPATPVDIVLANIHRSVLVDLMPRFAERLVSGGHCICSGCLPEEAPAMRKAATEAGFIVARERTSRPWWAVHFQYVD